MISAHGTSTMEIARVVYISIYLYIYIYYSTTMEIEPRLWPDVRGRYYVRLRFYFLVKRRRDIVIRFYFSCFRRGIELDENIFVGRVM